MVSLSVKPPHWGRRRGFPPAPIAIKLKGNADGNTQHKHGAGGEGKAVVLRFYNWSFRNNDIDNRISAPVPSVSYVPGTVPSILLVPFSKDTRTWDSKSLHFWNQKDLSWNLGSATVKLYDLKQVT